MTLGGIAIAIGALVDDAVVDVENIFRRLRENRAAGNPRSTFDVVVAASQEVRSGILYASAIIILVFVPLFALSGIEGRLFTPLGQAYIIAMLASLVVSITLTPVMAYYMLPGLKKLDEHESGFVRVLKRLYGAALTRALNNGRAIIASTLLAVTIAGVAAWLLPRAFLPPFNEGTLNIGVTFNPGVSLAESARVGQIAERLMLEVPEVKSIGRRTGRAELDEHAEGIHHNEFEVDLKSSTRSKNEVVADIRSRLSCSAAVDQRRPADLAPARSHAVGRARRRRDQAVRRRPRRAAQCGGSAAHAAVETAWPRRSPGRKAGPHSAARNPRRLQTRCALRRAAGRGGRPVEPAVERTRGVARGRRLPQLRRRGAAARYICARRSGWAIC